MQNTLIIFQIIISVLLIVAILVQVQGKGFGKVIGGGATSFTRRGLEKLVFRSTFILAFLFILLSLIELLA